MSDLDRLLREYDLATAFSERLLGGLSDEQVAWRPHEQSSAIGWHLGHQAAVNHFMVRNLTAAEPSFDRRFDALFDSATPELARGALPPVEDILAFRARVAASTRSVVERIASGGVSAPTQLATIAEGLLTAVINHEYQHDTWVLEVRRELGVGDDPGRPSDNVVDVDGYWLVAI